MPVRNEFGARHMHPVPMRERALTLYESGLSCREVARLLGKEPHPSPTPQTVARWARQAGVGRPPGDRRKVHLHAEAKRLYEAGWTIVQVANKYGVSQDTVLKRLREAGATIRPARVKFGHTLTADLLRTLYVEKNLRAQDIARRFRCSTSSVYNWLRRNRIPLKRPRATNK